MQNSDIPNNAIGDTFGGILTTAIRLFQENLALIVVLFLVTNGPSLILNLIRKSTTTNELTAVLSSGSLIWYVVCALLSTLIITVTIINKSKQTDQSLNQITSYTFKILPKYFFTVILQSVLTMLLFLLLAVPGIIYGTYWFFACLITLSTGKFGRAALAHSKELVKGRWWPTFGKIIGFNILIFITNLLLKIVLVLIVGANTSHIYMVIKLFLDILVNGFAVVLFLAMYLNYEHTVAKVRSNNSNVT